jgi:hypothetical protein
MCPPEELPPEVRQFILEKIDSVPHLEALLLVWGRPEVPWTDETLAQQLYLQPAIARRISQALMRRGWLKKAEPDNAFSFDSRWDPDGKFMQLLALTYRRQLVNVATLIHANASAGVREFADAFNLKKE